MRVLENYLNKVFPLGKSDKPILYDDLEIKKKVYKTLLKADIDKKELDKIYIDFIKKYKDKIKSLEEKEENIQKINKTEKKKRNEFSIFVIDAREILKTNKELLEEFNSDIKNIKRNNKNKLDLDDINNVFKKWKNVILSRNEKMQKSFLDEAKNSSLLKMNIENMLTFNKIQEIKKEAVNLKDGKIKKYRWLKTKAKVPDEEHLKLVGKIFEVGKGDKDGNMPGERYGCRCDLEFIKD